MDVPETDSEDEIPPGWEERCTTDGLVFYAFHETKTTQWTHPRTGKRKRVTGELPFGWERQINEDGKVFFVDHENHKTTYTDPRLAFAVEETEGPKDLRQKFDGSSTGMQITHGRDFSDQVAVITGANSGIGFESARCLAFHGCCVVFACRDLVKAEEKIALLKRERPYTKRCDILILNAGVFGLPYTKTEDSLEMNFQVNFLAHFYMCLLMEPLIILSKDPRVIFVSAESHRFASLSISDEIADHLNPKEKDYLPIVAYNNSKLCSVLGAFELHRRFADRGLKIFVVHPGNAVYSNLCRNWWVYKVLYAIVRPFTKSLQQAAACSVYCAISPDVINCSGLYINNCVPCLPSPEALSPVLANKLWVFSLDLIEQRLGKKAFFCD
ncbi:WW domain-containing oxidoreductase [Armadillidium nasatum]|uniref:WW domain-containing oxidoreductase n=1 Tax=Armadillidium nasatum TaxID=96803 RepID=A0A5N5T5D2_9CRUS|nr:WW domain-containing oxidoreductase [Armadillidium nasatum]